MTREQLIETPFGECTFTIYPEYSCFYFSPDDAPNYPKVNGVPFSGHVSVYNDQRSVNHGSTLLSRRDAYEPLTNNGFKKVCDFCLDSAATLITREGIHEAKIEEAQRRLDRAQADLKEQAEEFERCRADLDALKAKC